jgi:inosose dehydratase
MSAERVMSEAAGLGITAVESGPDGFLPVPPEAASRLLAAHGMQMIAGFVPVVLHDPAVWPGQLALVERRARELANAKATVLLLAAITERDPFVTQIELEAREWRRLFDTIERVDDIAARHGLRLALHPHHGTAIETREQVLRFLDGSDADLCLDTGHLRLGGADPVEIAQEAKGRIGHVHLKDVDADLASSTLLRKRGYVDAVKAGLFRTLGDGDARVARAIEVLGESGYDGWYVIERDVCLDADPGSGEGPVESVGQDLAFLRSSLAHR